ncbi:hypothetical protein [Microcoleus sp. MOSTC5]|uniref:hypothetical protein n=1 Tax=Microcoleus sp. MOSTC5 TaxID=3055378 RepID=UPI0040409B27
MRANYSAEFQLTAFSHSASVGKRIPTKQAEASASYQLTLQTGRSSPTSQASQYSSGCQPSSDHPQTIRSCAAGQDTIEKRSIDHSMR